MTNRMNLLIAGLLITVESAAWGASGAYRIVISEEATTPDDSVVMQYVKNWINCFECTNGELRKVLDSGAAAVPFLDQVLANSPDFVPDRTEEFNQHWSELRSYAIDASREVNISQSAYSAFQSASLRLTYHARAEKAKKLIAARIGPIL